MIATMRTLNVINDPIYQLPDHFTAYERFWLSYINDKRDLPFIHLLTGIHLLVIPVAILLFSPLFQGIYWWIAYVPYFYISQLYFKGRFGLMLHCIVHRRLFKKEVSFLQHWVIWVVCPFLGIRRKPILHIIWGCITWRITWRKMPVVRYDIDAIQSGILFVMFLAFCSWASVIHSSISFPEKENDSTCG